MVVRQQAAEMLSKQAQCWNRQLQPPSASTASTILEQPDDWTPAIAEFLRGHFESSISPVLTPLAFEPGHPFPFISNLSQNLAVVVEHGGETRFARVKVPDVLPRFVTLPSRLSPEGSQALVYLEDVIRANVNQLFPGTRVESAHLFRIVRDADLVIQEDEADDLLESIDQSLKQRRLGALVMLQVEETMPRRVLDILMENFEIEEENVYLTRARLGFGDWMQLGSLPRPDLKHPPMAPAVPWMCNAPEGVFEEIRQRDRLVHQPFQSFSAVEEFLRAAVNDPHVIAIKMTLYRIGRDSPMIDLLVDAVEAGKQVAVLVVSWKARFDERNNIKWANRLEGRPARTWRTGLVRLKTHAKVCLVVRQEGHDIRRYVHIATGNYNPQTARAYTDLGLFTVRPSIVEDASDLFNYLTGYSNQRHFRELLVAPTLSLRSGLSALIEHEADEARAGRVGHIIMKFNALTDPEMIRCLYRASQAGVRIDLIVRGVCSLRPGLPGVSDTIRVHSIVGRFLEHSRIFWFNNRGHHKVFIGSADIMERNLDRRIEVLCPIHDPKLVQHLETVVLDACLRDTHCTRLLASDGEYAAPDPTGQPLNSQEHLLQWYGTERRG